MDHLPPLRVEGRRIKDLARDARRDAEKAVQNVLVPASVPVEPCSPGGKPIAAGRPLLTVTEPFAEGATPINWHYFNEFVDLYAGNSIVAFFRLDPPVGQGAFPIIVRLAHISAPGGRLEVRGHVDPADSGGRLGE